MVGAGPETVVEALTNPNHVTGAWTFSRCPDHDVSHFRRETPQTQIVGPPVNQGIGSAYAHLRAKTMHRGVSGLVFNAEWQEWEE